MTAPATSPERAGWFKHNIPVLALLLALAAVAIGLYRTTSPPPIPRTARRSPADRTIVVDQLSLVVAEELVRLPTTTDERSFAQDALRIADQEMDLAFAQAVRQASNQTRPLTAAGKEAAARLQKAQQTLAEDQARVAALTAASAKVKPSDAQNASDRLELAKAQIALDQDEVDDARQDLRRAGGDPQGRIDEMIQEHAAASKASDSVRVNVTTSAPSRGLVNRLLDLQRLYDKEALLVRARTTADSLAVALKQRHDRLEARAAARRDSAQRLVSHDSSAALLAATQRRAADEKTRAALDQRIDNQHKLSDVYAGWITVINGQERAAINRALRGIAAMLLIALAGLLIARWVDHILTRAKIERRRAQTLYMVTRVSLQVVCVLLILLVIFGPPNNLGTFLGLAGAGLTVALKDFIVGFIGWFVLMGKNGIRIGDLVEINGVTGEVVELGLFYTVLLETGAWSESGHPTGRRVTFTNGFAIEGHFFNFSTSGRWLWDEVHILVPSDRDPRPIVEIIRAEIERSTADSARQAEAEWRAARRAPQLATLTAGPAISLRPASGGVEIVARYVTHVSERDQLRATLYQLAVEQLHTAVR